jgi:hypothetical protein
MLRRGAGLGMGAIGAQENVADTSDIRDHAVTVRASLSRVRDITFFAT